MGRPLRNPIDFCVTFRHTSDFGIQPPLPHRHTSDFGIQSVPLCDQISDFRNPCPPTNGKDRTHPVSPANPTNHRPDRPSPPPHRHRNPTHNQPAQCSSPPGRDAILGDIGVSALLGPLYRSVGGPRTVSPRGASRRRLSGVWQASVRRVAGVPLAFVSTLGKNPHCAHVNKESL